MPFAALTKHEVFQQMLLSPAWPLRTHLRAYALLFSFLPCALMAVFLAYYLSAKLHDRALDGMRRTVSLQKQFIDTWLSDRQRDVVRLAGQPGLAGGDVSQTVAMFRRFASVMPEIKGIVLVGPAGHTVADTLTGQSIYLGDREYFSAGREGRTAITGVITGRATGARIIIFSAPVTASDGGFGGVLFATVSLDVIEKAMLGPEFEFGGGTVLLDGQGTVIRDPAFSGGDDAAPQPKDLEQTQPGAAFSYLAKNGSRMIAVALRLETTGWPLVAAVPEDALSRTVRPVIAVVFSAGLLSFLAIMPLVFRLARSIEAVVDPLARHAKALSQGRYEQPPPRLADGDGPVEFTVLAEAYETMRVKIIEDMHLLETMALTDELTRLPNRRSLMEEGPRLLELSARSSRPCSCLVIDVDNFKAINDRHGHAAGDAALASVASALRQEARVSDLLGRLGGEEFLAVCANTGLDEARMLAERLTAGVRARVQTTLGAPVTVSVGVSTVRSYGAPAAELFDRLILAADMCMYQAKAAGRDRVVAATCDPGSPGCAGPEK